MGIAVFGTVFVDIKGYPSAQYIPGGRNAGRVVHVHGGVSRNVAEDIANIELRPSFISVVDDTGVGTDVIEKLRKHQVNVKHIRRVPGGLGTWLAIFDNSGDVVASISNRPDLSEISTILDEEGDEIFREADSIAVEMDMEVPILKKIFALADQYGKDVYGVISNMSIAMERRDLLRNIACIVCNVQEAELLFSENYDGSNMEELKEIIRMRADQAEISKMVVTAGENGAVYAERGGESGICPAAVVNVMDTTGAGDAFFAGVTAGLTYGKTLGEACEIGTRLAASVIATKDSVCPRFLPGEFGIEDPREGGKNGNPD